MEESQMNNEMTELQSQVARISAELADAQQTIRTLEVRKAGRPRAAQWLGIVVTIVALTSWGGYARQQPGNKVTAPFEVVDSAGKLIFRVSEGNPGKTGNKGSAFNLRGAFVCDEGGVEHAAMATGNNGGTVAVFGGDHLTAVELSADTDSSLFQMQAKGTVLAKLDATEDQGALLTIKAKDGASALIGVPEDGREIGLRVNNKEGKTIAAVYRNPNSPTGCVSVAGTDGKMAATMEMVGNEPVMAVFHNLKTVAALGADPDGRGYFAAYFADIAAAMLTTSDENPGAGRLTLNAPGGAWAVRAGYSGTHGDVAVGGTGAEGKAASHSLWASAVVGSLAK
jgi:hypothetical protein